MSSRILLAEDDFLVRITLSDALEAAGFTVLAAENAEQAIIVFAEQPGVKLLITDIQLGQGMDGYALAAALQAQDPTLPVIYTTGRADHGASFDPARARVLAKPFIPSDICAAAAEMLARD
jgi:CheY-like chemotaxis protein